MKKLRTLGLLGWLLVVAGVGAAAGYWLELLPFVKTNYPSLRPARSLAAFWDQKELCLKLGLAHHDDGWFVGKLGNKPSVPLVPGNLKSGDGLSCERGHMDVALRYLTNHDFGEPPEEVGKAVVWGRHAKTSAKKTGYGRVLQK